MPALKCPNPSCPFLFDPTQVPAGAVLTCPRCAMRFTLGPAQDAAPPAPPASVEASTSEPARRVRLPSTTDRGGPTLVTVLAVVGMVAAVVGGGVLFVRSLPSQRPVAGGPTDGDDALYPEVNCAFRVPGEPWAKDPPTMRAAGANLLGLKRADPEARAALAVSDYKTRNPQQGELSRGLEDRLKQLFDEPTVDADDPGTWAGQPAVRVRFRGIPKGQTGPPAVYAGEGYAIGHKGVGYWFLGWAPEAGAAEAVTAFAELRERFRLLDGRTDWKETTTSYALIAGKAADYRLQDGDRWWKVPPGADPKSDEADPAADLLLRAEFTGPKKLDSPPKATLVTYVLPMSGDPLAAVQAHVRAKYNRLYEKTEWTDQTDPPQGDPPLGAGAPPADTARYKVEGKSLGRPMLVALAAIELDDNGKKVVVGAEAYCPWADRGRWESRLAHLVGSLRAGK